LVSKATAVAICWQQQFHYFGFSVPTRDIYHDTVKRALKDLDSQVVFDDERGQYLALDKGWSGDNYLHVIPIHLSLIGDKVWIQYDDTEEGVATDLMAAGVSKGDIVLGFRHPKIRQHKGFAVA
jgi:hypothetical protein